MSGRLVRRRITARPATIALAIGASLVVGLGAGVIAALRHAPFLAADIPWGRIPAVLWGMRAFPIVWQPFLAWSGLTFLLCMAGATATIWATQRRPGETRWTQVGVVRKAKLHDEEAAILLGRISRRLTPFGGSQPDRLDPPAPAGPQADVLLPNLLKWPDSVVVLDVGNEGWNRTAAFRAQHLHHQTLLFDPLGSAGHSCRYNPLGHIDRRDPVAVDEELQKIGAILFPSHEAGDSAWAERARTAFLGVAAYCAATIDDGDDALPFTIGEIYRQVTTGDPQRRFPGIIRRREQAGTPLSAPCVAALSDWVTAPDAEFTSTRQSITATISLWLNPYVDAATAQSDVDLRAFRDERISLYLGASPDDLDRIAPLHDLLLQQIVELTVRERPSGSTHQVRLLLLLDDLTRLGRASVIVNGFSYAATYGIRLVSGVKAAKPAGARHAGEAIPARFPAFGGRTRRGASVPDADQRPPLLLQHALQAPREEEIAAPDTLPAPRMPLLRPDPAVTRHSLRVIASAEAEAAGTISSPQDPRPSPSAGHAGAVRMRNRLNRAAIDAALAAPTGERTSTLFQHVVSLDGMPPSTAAEEQAEATIGRSPSTPPPEVD